MTTVGSTGNQYYKANITKKYFSKIYLPLRIHLNIISLIKLSQFPSSIQCPKNSASISHCSHSTKSKGLFFYYNFTYPFSKLCIKTIPSLLNDSLPRHNKLLDVLPPPKWSFLHSSTTPPARHSVFQLLRAGFKPYSLFYPIS